MSGNLYAYKFGYLSFEGSKSTCFLNETGSFESYIRILLQKSTIDKQNQPFRMEDYLSVSF